MPQDTLAGYAKDAEPEATTGEDKDFSDEAMVARIREDSRRTVNFFQSWREEAEEDYLFALGEQWTQEEIATLESQLRPVLVINKTAVQIDVLSGYERNNGARIKANPEGSEDKVFSEVADKAIAYVDSSGSLQFKLSQDFDDGIISGKGVIELLLNYEEDPLHGDFLFRSLGPYSVLPDPDSMEYDLSDAEFCIKIQKYSKARLKSMYPKKKKQIDELGSSSTFDEWLDSGTTAFEGDRDNYENNPTPSTPSDTGEDEEGTEDKHTLVEYWYKRYVPQYFLYDIDQKRVIRYQTEEEAQARINELKEIYATDEEAMEILNSQKPIERTLPQMWVCAQVNDLILEHGISPLEPRYHGFPFFFFRCFWKAAAKTEKLRTQGLVRRCKDPQREINKARSQYLHILNTAPNSGFIGEEDALPDEKWDELEKFGSKPGILIKTRPGKKVDRIEPVQPSVANQLREKTATEDLKEVTGINADLLAIEDKAVSGKALAIRIKQALTIVAGIFDNWSMTKKQLGKAIFKLLPEVMDAHKLQRVVGEEFMKANQLNLGDLATILVRIEDGKYDISISEATDSETLRAETFEQLLEIADRAKVSLPPDLLVKWSTIPNSAEVAKDIMDWIQKTQQLQQQEQK